MKRPAPPTGPDPSPRASGPGASPGWGRGLSWVVLGASVLLALATPLRRADPSWELMGALWLLAALLAGTAIRRVVQPQPSARRWAHGQDLIVVALLLPAIVRCDVWLTTPHAFRVLIWGYGLPWMGALGVVVVRRGLGHARAASD